MPSFNRVILAGNLTRDPELRYLPKGTAVVRIGLAVNRTWKNESGETQEEVSFIDVEAFGRQAEVIAQYMRKGRPLLIEGRLKLDTWEDKNTHQKQSKLKVILEGFTFIDSKGPDGASSPSSPSSPSGAEPQRRPPGPSRAVQGSEPEGPAGEEDDVPF
jgi:single-strand DNA-binding protein